MKAATAARVPALEDVDTTKSTFRGPEVCALTGITYRQLDYWDRTSLVRPSIAGAQGSGTQRLYSHADIAVIRVINSILGGASTNHAHNDRLAVARAAAPIIRNAIESGDGDVVLVLTRNGNVAVADDADELLALVQLHQAVRVITVPALERDDAGVPAPAHVNTSSAVPCAAAAVG